MGIWKFDWLHLVALLKGIRSSRSMSMEADLVLTRVVRLVIALVQRRGGEAQWAVMVH